VLPSAWAAGEDQVSAGIDGAPETCLALVLLKDEDNDVVSALTPPCPSASRRSGQPQEPPPLDRFHYAFTNTLDDEAATAAYERYAAPGPGKVLFEGALANLTRHSPLTVDFDKADRAPLLLIAGGDDHVVPASIDQQTLKKYKNSESVVDYKEFPGRSHFTIGQPGWEEVADYALDWAEPHLPAVTR
jgi:pimeloyl-ACP methyl ester carboxylesterase